MAITLKNVGQLFEEDSETPVLSASVTFKVDNVREITMTKAVDRDPPVYTSGDIIDFTITIFNPTNQIVDNLVFQDELEEAVLPVLADHSYLVSTTSGIIKSTINPIVVSNITLNPKDQVVITIRGQIA